MRLERTKNASKNISMGMLLKMYQMFAPFLMRTAMLYFMGKEYLGLNSLFYSILHILNLAELGIGNAMVFSMYRPVAEDDQEKICGLMSLYRTYYRIIGLVIAGVGLALTPVIPHLIKDVDKIPGELNVYVLYWLNLGATVLTYWLFAYKNSLLNAHHRTNVSSMITMITTTLQYAVQLVIMLWWKNYYVYLIVALATQALNNVVTAIVTTKLYPGYTPRGKLSKLETKGINQKIRDLFTGKIGSVIMNSADSVVISAFLGLSMVTIYQNYYFIMSAIIGFIESILQSVMAGLGNSYITETKEKNYKDLEKATFLFSWLIGVCCCCFLGMYQPFIELWTGKDMMLPFGVVICFVVYFFAYTMNRLLNVFKDAAGLWRVDRFRPLTKAIINLGLNLLLISWIGLYGVLLSTVFAIVVVGMPWLLHNLFTHCFEKQNLKKYVFQLVRYVVLTTVAVALVWLICLPIQGNLWLVLVLRAVVSVLVPNVLFFLLLHKTEQFRPSVQLVDRLTRNKLKLEKKLLREKRSGGTREVPNEKR